MPGMLQQAPTRAPGKSNPLLDQIAQQAEAHVPDNLKDQFQRIMTVGGKLMWSPQMAKDRQEFDQALQQSGDVPTVVAHTVLKIASIVQNESKSDKPLDAMGLAAPIFMAHILQYVESKLGIPVTKDIIDQTGQLLQVNLLKMYGVTDQHIQELIKQRVQGQGDQMQPPDGTTPSADEEAMPEAQEPATNEPDQDEA